MVTAKKRTYSKPKLVPRDQVDARRLAFSSGLCSPKDEEEIKEGAFETCGTFLAHKRVGNVIVDEALDLKAQLLHWLDNEDMSELGEAIMALEKKDEDPT
jgi:hypothetical protein